MARPISAAQESMEAPKLYRPVKPKKISEQVFEQLRDLIFRGQLKPGERLPPERELAEIMGVSRPTVREAVGRLVHLGLMEQHQGQGSFVRAVSPELGGNPLAVLTRGEDVSLQDLLEVRLGLECNSAVLAARRATEEDVDLLERSLEGMRRRVAAGGLGNQEDVYFHMRLAYATKNPAQVLLMKHFYDLLHAGISAGLRRLYQEPASINQILVQHGKVLEAVRNRDPEAAFETMLAHIRFVMEFMEGGEAG
jgi:GntR family transcriptional repressor for pyruvate dehydrogenase complex